MVESGKIAEVNSYCLCDVAQTAAIFLRVELLRGALDRAAYTTLASALLTFLDGEPRVAEVVEKVDRERFLLTKPTS